MLLDEIGQVAVSAIGDGVIGHVAAVLAHLFNKALGMDLDVYALILGAMEDGVGDVGHLCGEVEGGELPEHGLDVALLVPECAVQQGSDR